MLLSIMCTNKLWQLRILLLKSNELLFDVQSLLLLNCCFLFFLIISLIFQIYLIAIWQEWSKNRNWIDQRNVVYWQIFWVISHFMDSQMILWKILVLLRRSMLVVLRLLQLHQRYLSWLHIPHVVVLIHQLYFVRCTQRIEEALWLHRSE